MTRFLYSKKSNENVEFWQKFKQTLKVGIKQRNKFSAKLEQNWTWRQRSSMAVLLYEIIFQMWMDFGTWRFIASAWQTGARINAMSVEWKRPWKSFIIFRLTVTLFYQHFGFFQLRVAKVIELKFKLLRCYLRY